ncbi:nuclear intron maturase 1, mitochondrial [Corylus avellana]|uniref:nuclear intron maturase 1, mitochondrial n=1 Tax=Corylus avellana TaxID=13451 RepID=UPI001E214CCA|nr:nuclear intron maturase 1, mitochondrial [Corylus avellana]XP_059438345.1 nuclear intron maturase 1, mitochondrial [Corylus avellana]XP_059438346.1 nuclear intron maturase 1, mitochondrial [Corylus avellana]
MSLRTTIKHLHCHHVHCLLKPRSSSRSVSSLTTHHPPPPPQHQSLQSQDPYALLKEDPIQICSSLWVKTFSSPPNATFPNLTGFLSKLDLWVLAYQRSCAHVTGTFPPRNAIHFHVLSDLLSLRNAVVRGQFLWNRKAQQYIRSPNEKPFTKLFSKRKLQAILESDEPCFQDRVVQEVLLMVLEPVFEARFSPKSHAFRPGRSAHTVIRTIRSNFAGYLWFLKGDLSEIFDNVDGNVVLNCVEKAVKDRKVLGLIKSALRGQVRDRSQSKTEDKEETRKKRKKKAPKKKKILNENEPKPDPYWLRTFFNFAPKEAAKVPSYGYCGILSPLFANVCLNELDHMMEDKIVDFFRPSKLDSIWKDSIDDGCHNPAWPEFVPSAGKEKTRKMDYIRYGGHFLIGIRGPREDVVQVRKEIIEFCESKFGLRLDNSKVEIEHITRGIQFLDHIICRRVIHPTLRYTATGGNIRSEQGVGTLLSVTASLQQCIRQFRRLELVKGDKDPEPLPCNPMLYSGQAHTNSQMNKFLETMADWYRYADNRKKVVGFCAYVIRSSLAKLYAARYRLKSRAKVYKIASRDLSHPLRESSNNSAPEYSDLLRMGLVDAIQGVQFSHMSLIPSCDYTPFPRNWVPAHEKVLREYIRLEDPKFFCDIHKSIKRHGLSLPQDEISEILWDYKTLGVWSRQSNDEDKTGDGLEKVDEAL